MQHKPYCDTEFHTDEGDGSEVGPCVGPTGAQVGPVGTYVRDSDVGPMVAFMPLPMGALIPVQQIPAFAHQLLAMVAKATGHS